jgi:DNA-binding transcriptional ArsR family regulator
VSTGSAGAPTGDAPNRDTAGTDAVLRALAEPNRRRILRLVRDEEMSAGRIAERFTISPQGVSQHLRVLKDAGLLRERREGTRRLYAIRPDALSPLRAFLEELWPSALHQLKQVVEADREPGR